MNNVKILHAIPSPRNNIPAVLKYQKKLPFDRIIPKYMREVDAYYVVRDYFLNHSEYTHLAIGTDDIVVKPEHIQQLHEDLKQTDYPVLTGMMNVYQEDDQQVNLTPRNQIPTLLWATRVYRWIYRKDLTQYTTGGPIFQVGFSGFPLMVIRRDVVEKIPFANDAAINEVMYEKAGSLDVHFCHTCHQLGIPIFADTRVDMEHLRMEGTMQVGKKELVVTLIKNKQSLDYTVSWQTKPLKEIMILVREGIAECMKCGAIAKGTTFQDACDKLDHAVGMIRNKPCPGGTIHVTWNGYKIDPIDLNVKIPLLKTLK